MSLDGKRVLITGAARRIGRALALAVAGAGADVVIHYSHSQPEAESARDEITALGRKAVSYRQIWRIHSKQWSWFGVPLESTGAVCTGQQRLDFRAAILGEYQSGGLERHLRSILPLLSCSARRLPVACWRKRREDRQPVGLARSASRSGPLTIHSEQSLTCGADQEPGGSSGAAGDSQWAGIGAILPPSDGALVKSILEKVPAGVGLILTR